MHKGYDIQESIKTCEADVIREAEEATAKADQAMIQRAYRNAQKLIEQYIINVGMELGHNYKIIWVNEPEQVNQEEVKGGTNDGE